MKIDFHSQMYFDVILCNTTSVKKIDRNQIIDRQIHFYLTFTA